MKTTLSVAWVAVLYLSVSGLANAQTNQSRWMGELADEYSGVASPLDQTLDQFIFPGSHDAGTYKIKIAPACDACRPGPMEWIFEYPTLTTTIFVSSVFTPNAYGQAATNLAGPFMRAQSDTVLDQLNNGSRAFDFRFFEATADDISKGQAVLSDIVTTLQPALTALGLNERAEDFLAAKLGGDSLEPLVEGQYYIHHTFSGPSSDEIFADIAAFVAAPGHDQEVFILQFGYMNSGAGKMSADSLREFFRQLFDTVGPQYFVQCIKDQDIGIDGIPDVCTAANRTLSSIINDATRPQQQIIVSLDSINRRRTDNLEIGRAHV